MNYVFTYYGCPDTEMWTRRAAFEAAHPHLNLRMRMDAPHYDSSATRIAYSEWEKQL